MSEVDISNNPRLGPDNDPVFVSVGICGKCKYNNKGTLGCKAFPDGIPYEILRGDYPHTRGYPGDQGIRFAPIVT